MGILVTELKEITTQKSKFRQKQKSHEVLAHTTFQLTPVHVNTWYKTSWNETMLSSKSPI